MLKFFARAPWSLPQFQALIEAKSSRWLSACLQLTQDRSTAEDAVQEALLKAWQARSQFRAEAELHSWIHRIAINCAIDAMRRRRPDFAHEACDAVASLANEPASAPALDQSLIALQRIEHLDQALKQLSALERTCFVLKHSQGYALSEIADRLRISEGGVKQALFRALKKLRQLMEHLQ
jgi:RNA polymerase sigma-70 factor (ECF subfamily)